MIASFYKATRKLNFRPAKNGSVPAFAGNDYRLSAFVVDLSISGQCRRLQARSERGSRAGKEEESWASKGRGSSVSKERGRELGKQGGRELGKEKRSC
jgi:hypothetical protein